MPTILDMKLREAVRRLATDVVEVTLAVGKSQNHATVIHYAAKAESSAQRVIAVAQSSDDQPEAE